jgi:hypothetical protein
MTLDNAIDFLGNPKGLICIKTCRSGVFYLGMSGCKLKQKQGKIYLICGVSKQSFVVSLFHLYSEKQRRVLQLNQTFCKTFNLPFTKEAYLNFRLLKNILGEVADAEKLTE